MTNKKSDRLARSKPHEVKPGHSDALPGPAPTSAEKIMRWPAQRRDINGGRAWRSTFSKLRTGQIKWDSSSPNAFGWHRLVRAPDERARNHLRCKFVDPELGRLMTVFQNRAGVIDAKAVNAGLALIDGLKPENELEAMLIAQMAATHGLAMKYSARLYNGTISTIAEQDSTALTLSRLQRAFTTQIDSLSNMRRGGRQKVVVEHVHVYPGGQAIVGDVTHVGRGISGENAQQAHATDDKRALAFAPGAEMRCTDQEREALPVAGGERQEALPDARGSARLRSAEGGAQRELSPRLLHRRGNRRTAGGKGSHS